MPADQRVTAVLRELQQQCKGTLDSTRQYKRADGGRRNELADQAAADHRSRSDALLDTWFSSQNPQDVIRQLRECRGHAEHWERQFAEWSRENEHDNGYARFVHDEASSRYASALDRIESLGGLEIGPVSGPASSDIYLLYGTNGGQDGEIEESLVIHEGVESSVELTGELSTKIFAKASASGDFLAAKVSGEAGAEAAGSIRSANTYKRNSHTTRTLRIRINLSKPSYFYQLKTDVQLTNDRTVTLWGGYFASSYPLK